MSPEQPLSLAPAGTSATESSACQEACCAPASTTEPRRDADWMRGARAARRLSWVSWAWMSIEGAIGMIAGVTAGSIALMGWALSSGVEGLASIIVIWRFTGSRTHSESAEARAQKAVAVSFWLLAPSVASESLRTLFTGHRPQTSLLGIVLTISSLLAMPALGVAKHRLGARLDSGATTAARERRTSSAPVWPQPCWLASWPTPGWAGGGWTPSWHGRRRGRGQGRVDRLARRWLLLLTRLRRGSQNPFAPVGPRLPDKPTLGYPTNGFRAVWACEAVKPPSKRDAMTPLRSMTNSHGSLWKPHSLKVGLGIWCSM